MSRASNLLTYMCFLREASASESLFKRPCPPGLRTMLGTEEYTVAKQSPWTCVAGPLSVLLPSRPLQADGACIFALLCAFECVCIHTRERVEGGRSCDRTCMMQDKMRPIHEKCACIHSHAHSVEHSCKFLLLHQCRHNNHRTPHLSTHNLMHKCVFTQPYAQVHTCILTERSPHCRIDVPSLQLACSFVPVHAGL